MIIFCRYSYCRKQCFSYDELYAHEATHWESMEPTSSRDDEFSEVYTTTTTEDHRLSYPDGIVKCNYCSMLYNLDSNSSSCQQVNTTYEIRYKCNWCDESHVHYTSHKEHVKNDHT